MVAHRPIPGLKLGILGGGQLGRMMAIEARSMGISTICLDPAPRPPALGVADETLQGDLYDTAAIRELANRSDVLTFEIEHINSQFLSSLEDQGFPVFPSPRCLQTIQDKFIQKKTFADAGLPVPHFAAAEDVADPSSLGFSYPVVQKTRTGGYDGRGVFIWNGADDASRALSGRTFFEEHIPFQKELAVLLARGRDGEIRIWPLVEMIFDPETQICTSVLAPARVEDRVATRGAEIAAAAVEALDGVGVFAVELFLTDSGEVLINEVAPRPHNSGHWTIEGSVTSQFNQHLRAVCGLPLGSTEQLMPAVMINLLGAPGSAGTPVIRGYDAVLEIPGLALHWYEKMTVSTQRKMGHITIIRPHIDEALSLAERAADLVRVEGTEAANG